jgi:hypothetical protein
VNEEDVQSEQLAGEVAVVTGSDDRRAHAVDNALGRSADAEAVGTAVRLSTTSLPISARHARLRDHQLTHSIHRDLTGRTVAEPIATRRAAIARSIV